MASTPSQAVASLIGAHLRPYGFVRSGLVCRRVVSPDIVHMMKITASGSAKNGNLSLACGLGVYIDRVQRALWGLSPDAEGSTVDCLPRCDLWDLCDNDVGSRTWWSVASLADAEACAADMIGKISKHALPLLNRCDSVEGAYAAVIDCPALHPIHPAPKLMLAIMAHLAGNREHASDILTSMRANPRLSYWLDRIEFVQHNLKKLDSE